MGAVSGLPTCEKLCTTVTCSSYTGANNLPMVPTGSAGLTADTCAYDGSDCSHKCCVNGMDPFR